MSLSDKQRRFVDEYLIDLNATQAAIRAGYSPKTANEQASRLLAKVNIQTEIKLAQDERAKRTAVTADRVIYELALVAFSDMSQFASVNDEGVIQIKNFDLLPEEATRVIKKIKERVVRISSNEESVVTQTTTEFEHHDKIKALELLGKHLKLFTDKVQHSGDKENPVRVEADYSHLTNDELLDRIRAHFRPKK